MGAVCNYTHIAVWITSVTNLHIGSKRSTSRDIRTRNLSGTSRMWKLVSANRWWIIFPGRRTFKTRMCESFNDDCHGVSLMANNYARVFVICAINRRALICRLRLSRNWTPIANVGVCFKSAQMFGLHSTKWPSEIAIAKQICDDLCGRAEGKKSSVWHCEITIPHLSYIVPDSVTRIIWSNVKANSSDIVLLYADVDSFDVIKRKKKRRISLRIEKTLSQILLFFECCLLTVVERYRIFPQIYPEIKRKSYIMRGEI